MSQAGSLNAAGSDPSIPTQFTTDSGVAVPAGNNLNILGGSGITTAGAGDTVTITATGSVSAIEAINVDGATAPGTDPVVPDGSNQITLTGAQVAAGTVGTNVIRTDSLAANTISIEIQRSSAFSSSDAFLNGVSHFDSRAFQVDSSGFVQLAGGTQALEKLSVQTFTAPGTDPVVPSFASIAINGAIVPQQSIPIQSNSIAASSLQLEVQRATATASTDTTSQGMASFNLSHFGVDANGYVSLAGGGQAIDSFIVPFGTSPVEPDGNGSVTLPAGNGFAFTGGANAMTGNMVSPFTGDFVFQDSVSGTTETVEVFHSSNTANSSSNLKMTVGGSSAGDPSITCSISGVLDWSIGVDNSDSDKFKISSSASPGTNDQITITTGGLTGIGTTTPVNRLDVEGALAVGASYSGTSAAPTNGAIIQGEVLIGSATSIASSSVFALEAYAAASLTAAFISTQAATGAGIEVAQNSGSAVSVATRLGGLFFAGAYDNANNYNRPIAIFGTAEQTFTSTAAGSFLSFETTPLSSTTRAERVRITAAGSVGIGTTTPLNRMDVAGSAVIGGGYAGSATAPTNGLLVQGNVGIGTNTTTNDVDVRRNGTGVECVVAIRGGSAASSTNIGSLMLENTGGGGGLVQGKISGKLVSGSTYGIEVRPDLSGNGIVYFNSTAMGINTSAPQSRLDVNGSLAVGSYAGVTAAPSNGILCSGQVSIGTNTSLFLDQLNIASPTAAGYTGIFLAENNGTVKWTIRALFSDSSLRFGDTGTYQFIMQPTSGNLGLGNTITALNKLDVGGAQVIGASYAGTNTAPTNGLLVQGNVGIGLTSLSSSAALEVSSTTQGVRFPNMTTTQRDAIGSPVSGLVIYNTSTNKLNVYTTAWEAITSA